MHFRPSLRTAAAAAVAIALVLVAGAAPASAGRRPPTPPRDTIPPTAPADLRATEVTQNTVALAWNPSTDNVGVLEYAAWAPGLPILRVPPSQTTVTFTALHPNSTYEFKVQAWDGWNWSWPSNVLTVTTQRELVPPSAPTDLRVSHELYGQPVDGLTASTVLLRWTSSTDNFGPIGYELLVDGVLTPNADDIKPVGTPSGSLSGAWVRQLRPGTTYQLTVRARDGSGNLSAPSPAVTVTTDPSSDTVTPSTPTLLSVSGGGVGSCPEELWIRWAESTDDVQEPATIEYEIRVNGVINEVATGGFNWIAYTDVLGPNTVTIVAVDHAGNASAPSNPITETTNWGVGSGCAP